MEEKNLTLITQTIQELVEKMGFSAKVTVESSTDGDVENVVCNINVEDDSNFLIGQYGANLQSVQHIARLIVRKKTSEKVRFVLDINDYRKQKNQSLIELAQTAAQQAISEKRAVVMRPMSAYERRIVHMELSKIENVVTESIGEGEGRKVVVKPAGSF